MKMHVTSAQSLNQSRRLTQRLSRRRACVGTAACAAALLMSTSTRAADYTWTNAVSGNWTDATNWTPNSAFPVAGDTGTFNSTGVNGAETVYLNGNQAV